MAKLGSVRDFFNGVDLEGIRIAWEIRCKKGGSIESGLIPIMRDHNMIHCVDLSKEDPALDSDIIYTRVLAKGEHNLYQFTDDELRKIDRKITYEDPKTAVITFHNVRMCKDAVRYSIYKQTGVFPRLLRRRGYSL